MKKTHKAFSELYLRDAGTGEHGRAQFELTKDFFYFTEPCNGCSLMIAVPKGFLTDFASVPRFFWRIFPPTGEHNKAAVIHDWLYTNGDCSRFFADATFRDTMASLGVPFLRRWLMYAAVRLFGGRYFRSKRGRK